MPFAMNTLLEIDQSVLRPVVMDMVAQIKQQTGMPASVPVYFPGDIGVVVPPGAELGSTDKENTALFANQKAIRIEVEQDFDLPDINNTTLFQCGSDPIFVDHERLVTITPIYFNTDVVIHFKYQTNSQAEAKNWHDNMRLRASQHGDINLNSVTYHYAIPGEHLMLLKTVYDLKQQLGGDPNQQFNHYLQKHFDPRLTVITDTVGQSFQYAIKENQVRIQGIYGFDAVPQKPSRDDSSGQWSIEFDYKFTFERPSVLRVDYPVMVHQSLMPMKYLTYIKDRSFDYNTGENQYSGVRASLRYFERDAVEYLGSARPINLPEYDVFTPPTTLANSPVIMTVLCFITQEDKRTLFNLSDMGDTTFHEPTLEYLRAVGWQHLCKPYRTVYTASLYENNTLMPVGVIECDSALNLTSTIDLDITKIYRVVISVNSDASMVSTEAIEQLVAYSDVLNKYIQLSYSNLLNLTKLDHVPITNRSDLNLVYWLLTGKTVLPVPNNLPDHPHSLPEYIVSSTNISKPMKAAIAQTAATIYRVSVGDILMKYGALAPATLLAAKNALIVTPRVMCNSIIVSKKET